VKDPTDGAEKNQEKIFKVALPVSLEAVFQTALGFIDQIIVGTLGATAVAAVGLCNSISFIVMLLYSAIGTGAGVLVAQAFGRNDLNDVSKVAALSLVTSGIFGIFTALPLVLYPGPILRFMFIGAPDELVEAGSVYFQLFCSRSPDRHECCRHRDFSVVERFKDTHVHHHGRGGSARSISCLWMGTFS
jgi:Na+-driven multidrug efflux pump